MLKVNDKSHSARKDRAFEAGRKRGLEEGKQFQQAIVDAQAHRIEVLRGQLSEAEVTSIVANQQLGATKLVLEATKNDLVAAQQRIAELERDAEQIRSQLTPAVNRLPTSSAVQVRDISRKSGQ